MDEQPHATEREGAYFVLMIAAISRQWLDERNPELGISSLFAFQQEALRAAMQDGIASGAFADADVSEETIAAICAEWRIPDAYDVWQADLERAFAQNRAILEDMP